MGWRDYLPLDAPVTMASLPSSCRAPPELRLRFEAALTCCGRDMISCCDIIISDEALGGLLSYYIAHGGVPKLFG